VDCSVRIRSQCRLRVHVRLWHQPTFSNALLAASGRWSSPLPRCGSTGGSWQGACYVTHILSYPIVSYPILYYHIHSIHSGWGRRAGRPHLVFFPIQRTAPRHSWRGKCLLEEPGAKGNQSRANDMTTLGQWLCRQRKRPRRRRRGAADGARPLAPLLAWQKDRLNELLPRDCYCECQQQTARRAIQHVMFWCGGPELEMTKLGNSKHHCERETVAIMR
jgi:hypothetical protein